MNLNLRRLTAGGAVVAALASFVVLGSGCSKKTVGALVPNQDPTVTLTSAPLDSSKSSATFYAYHLFWSGYDSDGRVDHFLYAIDPPTDANSETTWTSTLKNDDVFFFRASHPDTNAGTRPLATNFHVFVIKAVDDRGGESPPIDRAFYSYTIAPTVRITDPTPSSLLAKFVTASLQVTWTGTDPDGQFTQKPVKYKFKLFNESDPVVAFWKGHADTMRAFFAANNFADWDSCGGDTTFARYTNLTPGLVYLFVLIGYDEAGAYSPVWNLEQNMLEIQVSSATSKGPFVHIFNTFIDFTYSAAGYSNDPLRWINVEVPANRALTFFWDAIPPEGANIQYFRWAVDLADLDDNSPRSDEITDVRHWSQASLSTTQGTIPASVLTPGDHFLFVEAADNNGLKSLGTVRMTCVIPTLNRSLLIVDDTRRAPDKWLTKPPTGCPKAPVGDWPSASEIDTFFYAVGNVPWKCTQNPTSGVFTQPGVFQGYDYDTLGTKLGFENPINGVSLAKIGQYSHIIWFDDAEGSLAPDVISNNVEPMSSLKYMSGPGKASTLAAYVQLGGRVWLAGGSSCLATMAAFNKVINDNSKATLFDFNRGELIPGRLIYDAAHWRSIAASTTAPYSLNRSASAIGGWSHYDPWVGGTPAAPTGGTITAPDYQHLPATLRTRDPSTDPLPPSRPLSQSASFYLSSFPLEYIYDFNFIEEDVDPDPINVHTVVTLDTLYEAQNINLLQIDPSFKNACMTYYHGNDNPPFVFSGFGPWALARPDCIALCDFVLQDIWGLQRTKNPQNRGATQSILRPASQPTLARPLTPAQRTLNARLPAGRTRE